MEDEFESKVWDALKAVKFPGMSRDIVSFGFVHQVKAIAGTVAVDLQMATHNPAAGEKVREEVQRVLRGLPGVSEVKVNIQVVKPPGREEAAQKAISQDANLIPEVRHVVAVASGKGGVGKSTVAANLAVALAQLGHRVGLLDADIYGPSQPLMLGLAGQRPSSPDGKHLRPLTAHGVSAMSIGFLVDAEQPMVWRGPMVTQALEQLLTETKWRDLDYLVVDLPPGTGDIQLTLAQKVPVTGAVIVTTPQDIALIDARKGLKMFEKVGIPIIGVVENMAIHICSQCGHAEHIFGSGGGEKMCKDYDVEFLGSLPLDIRIREQADSGKPTVVSDPDGPIAAIYRDIARKVAARIARQSEDRSSVFPKIVIQNN